MKNHYIPKLVSLTMCMYISAWGGTLYPIILERWQRFYGVTQEEHYKYLSAPSRFAQTHLGLMLLAQASAAAIEMIVSKKRRDPHSYFGVIQAGLLLFYFHCLTYDLSLGDSSLYHGPEFSLRQVFRFGCGAYPVSIGLMFISWFYIRKQNRIDSAVTLNPR